MALRHMKLLCICAVFVTALLPLAKGQCVGSTKEIIGGSSEIKSPNFLDSEYGKAANCSWNFSPSRDGNEYALVLTVKQLRFYVVLTSVTKRCLGSYNLTIDDELSDCEKYAAPGQTFCKVYFSSPICKNISQDQECERQKDTSYPVPVKYFSDGRTDSTSRHWSTTMHFNIGYKFIKCPKATTSTAATATPSASKMTTSAETTDLITGNAVATTESRDASSSNIDPASTPTVTIALSAVVLFLLVGGIIGGIYFYKRLKSPSRGRSQRQQSISQDNPLPGEEDQPTNAIPDVAFHNYEEIQPPVLIETPGYEFPQRTGMVEEDEGGYVVPNVFQQGESSCEGMYAEAFQHLKPEPDYIEPETVRKEPNRRLVTKFKNPQKDRDLPTTSDGYLAFGKKH